MQLHKIGEHSKQEVSVKSHFSWQGCLIILNPSLAVRLTFHSFLYKWLYVLIYMSFVVRNSYHSKLKYIFFNHFALTSDAIGPKLLKPLYYFCKIKNLKYLSSFK